MSKSKLWLDDVRPCPFIGDGWITTKTYDEAVAAMLNQEIEEAFLDHDLSPDHYQTNMDPSVVSQNKSGYDFVLWMKEFNRWPSRTCMVHSMNPVGSKRMCEDIAAHYNTRPNEHCIPFQNIESYLKGKFKK